MIVNADKMANILQYHGVRSFSVYRSINVRCGRHFGRGIELRRGLRAGLRNGLRIGLLILVVVIETDAARGRRFQDLVEEHAQPTTVVVGIGRRLDQWL